MNQQLPPDRGLLPPRILLCYSAIALLIMLVFSWSMPPIDASGFRQTQTALSIDWMLRGGPFLSYLTPVLGARGRSRLSCRCSSGWLRCCPKSPA